MTAVRWACVVAAIGAAACLLLHPHSADLAAQQYRAGLVRGGGLGLWDNGWFGGHHTPAYSLLSAALGAAIGVDAAGTLSALAAAALFALLAERHWGARGGTVAAVWFAVGVTATLVSGRLTFLLGVAFGLAAALALQRARPVVAAGLAVLTTFASPVAGLFLALAAVAWGLAAPHTGQGWRSGQGGLSRRRRLPSGQRARLFAPGGRSRRPAAGRPAAHDDGTPSGPSRALMSPRARRRAWGSAIAVAALAPGATLAVLFAEGGTEPFVASAFWPALAAVALVAAALPARERALRAGCMLYALLCGASFAVATPLGGNVTRLGALLAGPALAGALLAAGPRGCGATRPAASAKPASPPGDAAGPPATDARPPHAGSAGRRMPGLLLALAMPLAYWQVYPAAHDVVRASGDPSTRAAYHAPLVRFLAGRPGSFRVEIPFTANHWEAAYVAPRIPLARGWERQLDRRYGALFYDGSLDAARYRAWLDEHAVAYVALPDAELDASARDEARLIERGLPYLRPVWHDAHWRVFAVRRPASLVEGAATTIDLGPDGFAIDARRRGIALVRVHHSRWWTVTRGHACVERAPGDMTRLRVLAAGTIRVQARLTGSTCRR